MNGIQGIILAGGQALRMQGRDKALLPLAGRPLIGYTIERLSPQVAALAINANGDPERYRGFDLPVLADDPGPVSGPLRGIITALNHWPDHPILTVAVDLPLLPRDCAQRLSQRLQSHACSYAVAGTSHALAILWAPGALGALMTGLDAKDLRVHSVLTRIGVPESFTATPDEDLGLNLNTPDDWACAERRLAQTPGI